MLSLCSYKVFWDTESSPHEELQEIGSGSPRPISSVLVIRAGEAALPQKLQQPSSREDLTCSSSLSLPGQPGCRGEHMHCRCPSLAPGSEQIRGNPGADRRNSPGPLGTVGDHCSQHPSHGHRQPTSLTTTPMSICSSGWCFQQSGIVLDWTWVGHHPGQ